MLGGYERCSQESSWYFGYILQQAEADFTKLRMAELAQQKGMVQDFNFDHLKAIHPFLFQDVYEWAGKTRVRRNYYCRAFLYANACADKRQ